ncbi:MAG: UMP kinase [Lachnospiraceae bacterium]|nr:UMP kinase [Lachnospiraceae bacterium]
MPKPKYKRILLKLSGEALAGEKGFGIDSETLGKVCDSIKKVADMGVEVAIVVGGGNFWRGRKAVDMERTTADYMGMLATIMNGQALQDALEYRGLDTRLQSSIEMRQIAELYIRRKAVRHLEKGRVVIFSGGTGNPFFSTDTCAALRATEINAEIILFGKTIDGVYDSDPKENPNAVKYDEISYTEILNKNLKVMDSTAASLCRDNHIETMIFALSDTDNVIKAVCGENIGTYVRE